MKFVFLLPALLALLTLAYYAVTKRRFNGAGLHRQKQLRLASESPALLASVASAMEHCSDEEPHISFLLSSGSAEQLLEKLMNGQLDIVLMSSDSSGQPGEDFDFILIPRDKAQNADSPENTQVMVLWKKSCSSKSREHFVFALENEYFRLNCAYADYM